MSNPGSGADTDASSDLAPPKHGSGSGTGRKNACSDPHKARKQFGKSFPAWAARARQIAVAVPRPKPEMSDATPTPTPTEAEAEAETEAGCAKCSAREARRRHRLRALSPVGRSWDEAYLMAALAGSILGGETPKQLPSTAKNADAELAARGAELAAWWREKFPPR